MSDLDRIRRNRFVVLGRAGMDLYAHPQGTRVEDAASFVAALGGSSANICAGIARQGGDCALVTRVSDDAIGLFALAELDRYGIDRAHVTAIGGEFRNSLAVVATRLDDTQSVIYRNGAADFQMSSEDVADIDYDGYGAMITTGTVLAAEPSRSAAFAAFEQARAAGLPLIFDIDYRPYSWASAEEASETFARAAGYCDIVVGNDVEFGFLAGDYDRGLESARELVQGGVRIAVYKMGEEGAITITHEGEFRTGIYAVEALKPTGAGDGFMGGFVVALAAGRDVQDAVLRGSASAAIVVTRVGCAPAMPTPEELDAFIADHPGPTPS